MAAAREFTREAWAAAHPVLVAALSWAISERPLSFTASWPISAKSISEIGGRLIEDWLISSLPDALTAASNACSPHCSNFRAIAVAGRAIGDTAIQFSYAARDYTVHIDVKAANLSARDETHRFYLANSIAKKRPGESHPNLISLPRAELWYRDPQNALADLAILYCGYRAIVVDGTVTFDLSRSLNQSSLFLLRDISPSNVTVGALGRGQLQLTRTSSIRFAERTKAEFCAFLQSINKTNVVKKSRTYA
jgi:hypothetical protein